MACKLAFLITTMLCSVAVANAQQWSGVIAPGRAIDWSQAGVIGEIPTRTTICTTLNPGATATQINSAIANCPANQAVYLNAGTYNLSGGLVFNNKRDVTLRGAGANQTFLVFSAKHNCGGVGGDICFINGDANWTGGPGNTANWTSGYAKGTTQIKLSSTSNLKVGTLLNLDQNVDASDDGTIFMANNAASKNCLNCGNSSRVGKGQTQIVRVTAINGNDITISPGIYSPNWRSDRSPQAWWSGDTAISGSGVENLSLDGSGVASGGGIVSFFNAYGCWAKGIRSVWAYDSHVKFWQSAHNTVRDSYFYGNQAAVSQSYGTDTYIASDNLVINNIFHRVTVPTMNETSQGDVYAYNYSIYNFYSSGSTDSGVALHSAYTHAGGNAYFLWEGNAFDGLTLENFHGPAHFITAFRNRFIGKEGAKNNRLSPIIAQSYQRYANVVGNVLGNSAYHTNYTSKHGDSSTSLCERSIYALGWSGNCANWTPADCSGYVGCPDPDLKVEQTLMRWGNYDTVTATNRFIASEVPSGLVSYANPVPVSQTLPPSFFLSAKPLWWPSAKAWPPIGPDVTGGNIPGTSGRAYTIPAQDCYANVMSGPSDGTGGALSFNAVSCYGDSGSVQTPPTAPTILQVF